MNKIFLGFAFIFILLKVNAADYYWVGGSGKWSEYGVHWAKTSGGAVFHNQVPSPLDNVFFDANSSLGPNTIIDFDQTTITCNSFTVNSTGEVTFSGGTTASALNISGSMKLATGVLFDFNGKIVFKSTSVSNTIKQNGGKFIDYKTAIEFNGIGGEWLLEDSLVAYSLTLINGSFKSTGKKIAVQDFISNSKTNRKLDLTNSKVIVYNNWNIDATGLVSIFYGSAIEFIDPWRFTSDSDIINYDTIIVGGTIAPQLGFSGRFNAKKIIARQGVYRIDFYNECTIDEFISYASSVYIGDSYIKNSVFKNLTNLVIRTALKVDNIDLSGEDCRKFINVSSDNSASIIKVSGILNLQYAYLKNINASGGATFNATDVIDLGGNTGWNIAAYPAKTMYWIGGAGDWYDVNHWSYTSGGISAGCIPTIINDVVFDNNSFASGGQVVSLNGSCHSIDCRALSVLPSLKGYLNVYGSFKLKKGMGLSQMGTINFLSSNTNNEIDVAGNILTSNLWFEGSGSWHLTDSLYVNSINYLQGALYTNGNNINCNSFDSDAFVHGNRVLDFSSSVITVRNGTFKIASGSLLLNAGKSVINVYKTSNIWLGYSSLVYNDINFYGNSNFIIWGDNIKFNKVSLNNMANLKGSFTFDTLILKRGYGISISNSKTQTVNDIIFQGTDCSSTQIISEDDNQVTIVKASGVLSLSDITLKNVIASGGATFNANNCIDLGGNSGWNITTLMASTLYWIGGSGKWTEPSHWSLTSGGISSGCIPASNSNVIFDNNSFNSSTQTVTIDLSSVTCNNMIWDNLSAPVYFNGSDLIVNGDLQLNKNVILKLNNIYISPTGNSSFLSGGVLLPSVMFIGNGNCKLMDDIYSSYHVSFASGNIDVNKKSVNCGTFALGGSMEPLSINLDSVRIYSKGQIDINEANLTVTKTGLEISCSNNIFITNQSENSFNFPFSLLRIKKWCEPFGTCDNYIYAFNTKFENVIIDSVDAINFQMENNRIKEFTSLAHKTIFSFNGTIDFADLLSTETDIQDNMSFGYLKLNQGKTYKIKAGKTITVTNNIEALGASGYPIYIISSEPGIQATLSKTSGTFCFDYLYISDMKAAGGAVFNAGIHSTDVSNNSGWNFITNCSPLSASYNYPVCEGSTLNLTVSDQSNSTYSWSGPDAYFSTYKNSVINNVTQQNSGIYKVTSDSRESIVSVVINELPSENIFFSSNYLMTYETDSRNNYVWYKDGVLLTDISGPYYTPNETGDYYCIITSPEGCSVTTKTIHYGDFFRPDAPVLSGQLLSPNTVAQLMWTSVSDNTLYYYIEKSLSPNFDNVTLLFANMGSISYTDNTLQNNKTYYYRIKAYSNNGNSEYSNVVILSTGITSLKEQLNDGIKYYPNPTNGISKIETSGSISNAVIKVMNYQGNLVYQIEVGELYAGDSYELDLTSVEKGIYYLQIVSNESRAVHKIIVE